ncbi:hypothetical protein MKO06_06390 [Gramella sp. GC03-9]|uniref:Beta-lactamase-inhibitor-like PepSY-like domain-containing protein n=1 Tax=Christiangramia oceanisediminis TaxID=2920386 RepID=A0A9X2KVT4_9FLAO|nr:hypothetical protein [Gramella oceanisediminis]MCP9199527.1 hypothetical protein [Gramella oceanisediminis]
MKKFVLSIMCTGALFFATQNMSAQVEEVEEISTEVEMQEEYASVEVSELPQAVKDAIEADYSGAVATEAWMKTKEGKKVYKLKLDVDGKTEKVYIDQDGNWMKKDKNKDTK